MKTELELEFKKETGFRTKPQNDLFCQECGDVLMTGEFYTSDFVDFLITKIETLQRQNSEAILLHDYKSDYENAVCEIGQLQDQLENAEDEIRELNSNK
jgi:hypothetical protein